MIRKTAVCAAFMFTCWTAAAYEGLSTVQLIKEMLSQNSWSGVPAYAFADLALLPVNVQPSAADNSAQKEWTVMVFMNAKNNLAQFAFRDINEMEAASADKLSVLVELGIKEGAKRYKIERDYNYGAVTSPVLLEDSNADMGDYNRVAEFVSWARQNYPAKRYMLILWNHGFGWLDPKIKVEASDDEAEKYVSARGVSFDDETKNYITTPQLAEMFKKIGRLDYFATNACLMQMVEVIYQARGSVDVISGSEDFMLGDGYDYVSLLSLINNNASAPAEKIGELFLESYYKSYHGIPDLPLAYSAVRVSALDSLSQALGRWAAAVKAENEKEAVKKAVAGAVRFYISDKDPEKELTPYTDLYDFIKITSLNAASRNVRELGFLVRDYINSRVIIRKWSSGEYLDAGGLSVQTVSKGRVPDGFYDHFLTNYDDLPFAKDSGWGEFIKWLESVK